MRRAQLSCTQAIQDFRNRVKKYEEVYEPLIDRNVSVGGEGLALALHNAQWGVAVWPKQQVWQVVTASS